MNFETTVGLEVHIEMQTNSKAYSPSPVQYGAEQNTNTNVIDWGYPGVLPEINKGALEFGMRAALAFHCDITQDVGFDRKNYFYPDNPKAYQITQARTPIGTNGWLEIELENGTKKKIGIREMHVEEDAGKNTHNPDGYSYVDLNRQGTPLIEIVAEPDISSADEAYAYLTKLRQVIQFTGISDVKMEEGSMRADVNVSIAPIGSDKLGVRTEMKNLNSFEHVRKGIQYEVKRQERLLMSGGEVEQETRRFDEPSGETILMRSKEEANDYRYFPEPDLVPFTVSDEYIEKIRQTLPELPDARKARYMESFGLSSYDADYLTNDKARADYFEAMVKAGAEPKEACNWLMGEFAGKLSENGIEITESPVTPEGLAALLTLIAKGTISGKIAKQVFPEMWETGKAAEEIVKEKGLIQISDTSELEAIVMEVIQANPKSVEDFKAGNKKAVGFFMGQIMKATKGKANPRVVSGMVMKKLQEL